VGGEREMEMGREVDSNKSNKSHRKHSAASLTSTEAEAAAEAEATPQNNCWPLLLLSLYLQL